MNFVIYFNELNSVTLIKEWGKEMTTFKIFLTAIILCSIFEWNNSMFSSIPQNLSISCKSDGGDPTPLPPDPPPPPPPPE